MRLVRVEVVVLPSLPVIANILADVFSQKNSTSEVRIAPDSIAGVRSPASGRIPGERNITALLVSQVKFLVGSIPHSSAIFLKNFLSKVISLFV